MPINVSWEPQFAAPAMGAWEGGMGQYRQRQQQIDFQQALAAVQAQQQAQAHADSVALQQAHLQQQAAQMNQGFNQQAFQNQMQAAGFQNQVGQQGFHNSLAQQQMGLRREDMQNDQAWRQANLQQNQDAQQNAWDVGGVQNLEAEVAARQKTFGQADLTPEGKLQYNKLAGALRGIQEQRPELRPGQYQGLLSDWLNNFDQAGLENHKITPPTIDDLMTKQMRPVMIPDGKGGQMFSGHVIILQKDGKMDTRQVMPDDKFGGHAAQMPEPRVYFSDPTNRAKAFKDAQTELEKEAQAEAMANSTAEKVVTPEAVKQEAVYKRMLDKYNADRQFLQQLQGGQQQQQVGTPGQQAPPGAPAQPPAIDEARNKKLLEMGITPAQPDERAMGLIGSQRMGDTVVPVVRSDAAKQVLDKLPAGAIFRGDDGKMYRKPVAKISGGVPHGQPLPSESPKFYLSMEQARKEQTYGRLKVGVPFGLPDGNYVLKPNGAIELVQ
jgi:hypothetical protein